MPAKSPNTVILYSDNYPLRMEGASEITYFKFPFRSQFFSLPACWSSGLEQVAVGRGDFQLLLVECRTGVPQHYLFGGWPQKLFRCES